MDWVALRQDTGEKRYIHACDNNNHMPSRSVHYKQNKARNWRKILDRTSHHRRRNIMKSALKRGVEDFVLPSGKGAMRLHKKQLGAHEAFATSAPKPKPIPIHKRFGMYKSDQRLQRSAIPVENHWHDIFDTTFRHPPQLLEKHIIHARCRPFFHLAPNWSPVAKTEGASK